jgi:hypothetical protein
MKKRKLWKLMAVMGLAVTSLLLLFLLLGQIRVGAAPGEKVTITDVRSTSVSFAVSGTVICEGTGPISDVEVYSWKRDKGGGDVSDTTDSNGYYSVTLEAGNYDLIFNPPCGSECASKAHKGITGPPDLTLNVVLSPGHSVSGTVFATDGTTPVDDVSIYAFNHDTADGFGLPLTKAGGHYCIGLVEGPYDLGFTPPPCLGLGPKTVVITVTQDMITDVILPPGFTVAGCITDGIDNPVPGVQIYAYDPNIRGFGFAPSDESGCYSGTLPLGTFDIQFIPPAGRGLGPITVVDVISETAGCPNTSLPITLPAGFTVSGTVTCQGQPVKNVFVYADPLGGGVPGDDLVGWEVYSVDDGSYGLPVVPGTYDIKFIPPPATGFDTLVTTDLQVITDTVLDVDLCPLVLKSVDELFAAPGERRTYQIVLDPEREFASARLTDTLPSAVTWAGNLSVTGGNASYSDGILTWSGSLTNGVPVTITYDVKVTYGPCFGMAATDIYTDVYNDAMVDDGQGNISYSTPAVFAIGRPFGTGSDWTFAVDFGDADNDGHLDLAVGNHGPNQVCWNNGDGTFDCQDEFGGSATFDVEWGDMNGDGYLDLVVSNSQGHANQVYLNNKDRTFTCTDFSTCSDPTDPDLYDFCHVALGDVDCNGYLDIAVGTRYVNNILAPDVIYYNAGDATFPITDTACQGHPTLELDFGDVDGDGDLDLAVVGHYWEYVCINANDCTGTFTETRWLSHGPFKNTWSVALGDVDERNGPDVAVGRTEGYPNEVYLNDGSGYFPETLPFGPVWEQTWDAAWGDVDGDGDLDLASGNTYRPTVVYFNEPVTATPSFTLTKPIFLSTYSSHSTSSVAFGDVDSDGDLDLAVGSDGGQNVVYLNTLTMTCVNYLPIIMKDYPTP